MQESTWTFFQERPQYFNFQKGANPSHIQLPAVSTQGRKENKQISAWSISNREEILHLHVSQPLLPVEVHTQASCTCIIACSLSLK